MKQLGIALHNFHDVNLVFPAVRDQIPQSPALGTLWVCSWHPRILPYVEQQGLFQLYRFDRDWQDAATNDAVGGPIKQNVPGFTCPSAPGKNTRPVNTNRALIPTTSRPPRANIPIRFSTPGRRAPFHRAIQIISGCWGTTS